MEHFTLCNVCKMQNAFSLKWKVKMHFHATLSLNVFWGSFGTKVHYSLTPSPLPLIFFCTLRFWRYWNSWALLKGREGKLFVLHLWLCIPPSPNWRLGDLLFRSGPDRQFRAYRYGERYAQTLLVDFSTVKGEFSRNFENSPLSVEISALYG